VALTAFRLGQKELRLSAWPSWDAFLNGCLLRRPPREFADLGGLVANPVVAVLRDDSRPLRQVGPLGFDGGTYNAGDAMLGPAIDECLRADLVSRVRYFTRDATLSPGGQKAFAEAESLLDKRRIEGKDEYAVNDRTVDVGGVNRFALPEGADGPTSAQAFKFGSGVAGWSDFNHPGQLARQTLTDAAGIVIPRANYVVGLLAIYLAVLVPLNWVIFRLMGRVEWAWIAAPIITIICTVAVIRSAELDIGFARSRTELAVVEIQGDYPRAHVTRYSGVYTSLATSYDVQFDDPSSVAMPYPTHSREELKDTNLFLRHQSDVQFRRDDKQITLTGFDVSSNSTGMLHAEHMVDLGGGIAAKKIGENEYELANRTSLDLRGAAVLDRERAVWIGDFGSGAKKEVTLAPRELSPRGDDSKAGRTTTDVAQLAEKQRLLAEREAHLAQLGRLMAADHPEFQQVQQEIDRLRAEIAQAQIVATPEAWFAQREEDEITSRVRREDVLKARLLVRLAESTDTLADGELRLVAWTNEELPGMDITPRASQTRFANIIVAHLRYDGLLKHGKWTLGYRNEDKRSREEIEYVAKSQGRGFGDEGLMLDGALSDTNGDGVPDVLADPALTQLVLQGHLQKFDDNGDAVLDVNEWPEETPFPFNDVDLDKNKRVTAAELETYLRQRFKTPPAKPKKQ
jgi:hypothetical protein